MNLGLHGSGDMYNANGMLRQSMQHLVSGTQKLDVTFLAGGICMYLQNQIQQYFGTSDINLIRVDRYVIQSTNPTDIWEWSDGTWLKHFEKKNTNWAEKNCIQENFQFYINIKSWVMHHKEKPKFCCLGEISIMMIFQCCFMTCLFLKKKTKKNV